MDYSDENLIPDLVLLKGVNDKECQRILENRFVKDKIYTNIGEVLVAVNPYKKLDHLYSTEQIKAYTNSNVFEHPPHVFSIGDRAYRSMRDRNVDQTVMITGESGSGKTETSKLFMQYIATVSGNSNLYDIKQKLLESNPCLEAFGNAKTLRNDNSSRFGKLMDIAFDFKCAPVGGTITTYLLEKSRVVDPKAGERSFHIFYQLLKGLDELTLKKWKLERNPDRYDYLSCSKCTTINGIDDAKDYSETINAMGAVGIDKQNQSDLLQSVAAVLHLGNVTFAEPERAGDAPRVTNAAALNSAAELLGVTAEALTKALTYRNVEDKVKKTVIYTPNDVEKAYDTRNALAKTVYGRVFDCLVNLINSQISSEKYLNRNNGAKSTRHIGVLDIYGFEIFDKNGYDQFLINYCNEKLQQLFIDLVLKTAQEEYASEGIPWVKIEYFDNLAICQLIDSQQGIIAALNDECLRPGNATDVTLLDRLDTQHHQNPYYSSRKADKGLPSGIFVLKHYAGNVTYTVDGFVKRNLNPLPRLAAWTLNESSSNFISNLFPESASDQQASLKRAETLATQFKQSMQALVTHLKAKQPHYIRCLKPNDEKAPNKITTERMLHQIRYLGIIENIKVRRAGYCFLQPYTQFVERYKALCPELWPRVRVSPQDGSKILVSYLKFDASEFAWGKTKVFVKNPTVLIELEKKRNEIKNRLAIKLQAVYRGHREYQRYSKVKNGFTRLQATWKMQKCRRHYVKKLSAAATINRVLRGRRARKQSKKLKVQIPKHAARFIQKVYRAHRFRQFVKNLKQAVTSSPPAAPWYQMKRALTLPLYKNHKSAAEQIVTFYYRSKALEYRRALAPQVKERLSWKLAADLLFKSKKESYERSIPVEFAIDAAKVSENPKWRALNLQSTKITCALECEKLHRSALQKSAKRLLVLTNEALYVLEPGSYAVKEAILMEHIAGFSCSTMSDSIFAIHFSQSKKGDIVLQGQSAVYPMLSKLYQCLRHRTSPAFKVNLTDSWSFSQGNKHHNVSFKKGQLEDSRLSIAKSGNDYQVTI